MFDPVCGMQVGDSALRAEGYDQVAFCSEHCRRAFLADPQAYLDVAGGHSETDHAGHDAG